ncbi:MAG: hypothetical protein IJU27_07640 [Bacteroidales bacterium]|nr:hypothetical protein [Bacteroidales bacterium]
MNISSTLRLDNASLIYPASLSKKYASLYRMSVTLSEPVDTDILQKALDATVKRIPTMGYTLTNGAFWWHLVKMDASPKVLPYSHLHKFSIKGNGGFLFKLSANDCRIVLDIFHVLTDGGGAMTMLLTLTAEYLRLRYGVKVCYGGRILDPADTPYPSETADAFDMFSGKKGALEQNDPAYHVPGRVESNPTLHDMRIRMPLDQVSKAARKYDATVTELLTAAMLDALQEVRRTESPRRSKSILKVSVPVDLRRIFGSCTLRNFSSYVNLGVDVRNGNYPFEELVRIVSGQKRLFSMASELEPKVAKNVELEDNFAISCLPRFIKKPIIDIINKIKGDRYCTHTLSNIGLISLPVEMQPYVRDIDFMLGRQRGNSGASACVGYNGTLFLNMSRRIAENHFENLFLERMRILGVKAQAEERQV